MAIAAIKGWAAAIALAAWLVAWPPHAAMAAPAPLDRQIVELSAFMKPISAPDGRMAVPAGDTLSWAGFEIGNPGQKAVVRRLEFEPLGSGPFSFLYVSRSSPWLAVTAQGAGASADMIQGRQGFAADIRLEPQAAATIVVQLNGQAKGVWRLWQPAAWDKSMSQAVLLRGLFSGALIAAAAWLTGLAVLRFAAGPFWGALTLLSALAVLLCGAGLLNLGAGGHLLAGAVFCAAALHFVVTVLDAHETRRSLAMMCDGLAIGGVVMAIAAPLGGVAAAANAGALAMAAGGLSAAALILLEAMAGNGKARALLFGAGGVGLVAAAPMVQTDGVLRAIAGWPLVLDGGFVMGLLVSAFAATAPRRAPINEEEAAVLVQERKLARDAEYRYALGLAAAHQGLWDWNLETDALYVSPSVEAALGLAQGSLAKSERNWAALVHPEDSRTYETTMAAYKAQGNASFMLEMRMRHARGAIRWMQLKASFLPGRRGDATRCIGIVADITDHKQIQHVRQPQEESADAATGLAPRSLFLTRLDQVFATVAAAGVAPRGVVMAIDLERMRAVKEAMGEAAGDRFLSGLAGRIQAVLGPADLLARVGSEELALLILPDDFGKSPDTVVMRVREALSKAVPVGLQDVFPAATVGAVALGPQHKQGGDALREAEVAMHHAKRHGLGGYEVYKAEMKPRSADRLSLDADLRQALDRGQIEVVFQPIVSLRRSRVAGFEALLRWRHHQRGDISPMEFVPLAEETGLIVPLGSFALKQAIAALEDWFRHFPQDPPLFLSVNVSPRQLFRADFVNEVSSLLRGRAFPPGALKLEVTETVVMRDLERSMAVLSALRKLGVGLSLDDFGTGYSSLSYLQRFPFDALKIDRSFVTSLTATQDAGVIVNSIITLAHSLNMNVVAEGVENQPEAVKLAQMGCEFAQGYLFGQAMDARGVMQMLMQRARPYPGHTPGLGPAAGGRKL